MTEKEIGKVKILREALQEIARDCEECSGLAGIEDGERRLLQALRHKALAALREAR